MAFGNFTVHSTGRTSRPGVSRGKAYVIRSGNPWAATLEVKVDSARAPPYAESQTSPHFYEVVSTSLSCATHFENVYREGTV